jgi:hypothetical protein
MADTTKNEELKTMLDELDKPETISDVEQPTPLPTVSTPPTSTDIEAMVSNFNDIKSKILKQMDGDRAMIMENINFIAAKAQGDDAKQCHIEGLCSLLATLAGTNADGVKLMDSMAKMVSAYKTVAPSIGKDSVNLRDLLNSEI